MSGADRDADSAGFPWEGRTFNHHDTEYKDDDGSIPAGFAAAMAALRAQGDKAAETDALARAVASLAGQRLLIPLVAEAGETGHTPAGKLVDKSQDLSIPTVEGPDGAPILPVFSNAAAMSAWNPKSRPVPASVQRVVFAALEDDAQRVVIDGGTDTELVLTAPVLRAMAAERDWSPAYARADVMEAIGLAATQLQTVAAMAVVPGDPQSMLRGPEILIVLVTGDEAETRSELPAFVAALGQAEPVALHAASIKVSLYPLGESGLDVQFPPGSRVAGLRA